MAKRRFKAFAAVDAHQNLIWGTIARTAEQAKEIYDRHNPDATGQGMGETIQAVDIYLTK